MTVSHYGTAIVLRTVLLYVVVVCLERQPTSQHADSKMIIVECKSSLASSAVAVSDPRRHQTMLRGPATDFYR